MDDRTDDELLKGALDESNESLARQAASELLRRYQDRVFCWCLRRVQDPEQARDLAQEVLISAYRHLRSFAGRARFSSWLFAITHNCCLSALRRPHLVYDLESATESLVHPAPGPEQEFEERAAEQAALELIRGCLDPFEQEVLWLRCFERVPVETITGMMNIRESSGARGVLQRARRKLRAALAQPSFREKEVAGHDRPLPG